MNRLTRPAAYEAYLRDLASPAETSTEPVNHQGAGDAIRDALSQRFDQLGAELVELSHDVHAHPELGFEEHHAAAAVADLVRRSGIEIEVGTFGLETSFRAVVGQGSPRVAIIAEYDALPGIGHACGHNIICSAGVGAFLAAAPFVDELGGSIELIGTPAEEGGSGKEIIARAGGFDGIDCAMMVHPGGAESASCVYLGMRQVEVDFHGLSAHASAYPFMGRNALDACVSAYSMIAQLRQHVVPGDRIHGVITNGGDKPNIVPDLASALYYLRSERVDTLLELTDRVHEILTAAATGTGTHAEIRWDPAALLMPVRNNMTLAARYATAQQGRGRPTPLRSPVPSGSTDMGNVSVRVPSIHPKIAVSPPSVAIHTKEFATYAGGPHGDTAVIDGAFGLAMTALDFLADPALRAATAAEFDAAGGPVDVPALDR